MTPLLDRSQRLATRPSVTSLATPATTSHFHSSALRLALSTDARKKIDAAVSANPLVIFMKGTPDLPMCGFSRAVCQIMEVQGVKPDSLKTYNCLDDPELREGIKEYSSWPTIPQVYVNGEFVGGCDIMLSSECRLNTAYGQGQSAHPLLPRAISAPIRRTRADLGEGRRSPAPAPAVAAASAVLGGQLRRKQRMKSNRGLMDSPLRLPVMNSDIFSAGQQPLTQGNDSLRLDC